MDKIYVVVGTAGDHDDYRIWMTVGFRDVSDAEKYREMCMFEADRIQKEMDDLDRNFAEHEIGVTQYWDIHESIIDSNAVDKSFSWDEPVEYRIDELEIR